MFATTKDTFYWIPKSARTAKHIVICECKGTLDGYLHDKQDGGFEWTSDNRKELVQQPLRKLVDGYIVKQDESSNENGIFFVSGYGHIRKEIEFDFLCLCVIKLGISKWYKVEPSKKTITYTSENGDSICFTAIKIFLVHAIDTFDVDIDHVLRRTPDTLDILYSSYV